MKIHGEAEWYIEDNILIGNAKGPFNTEAIISLESTLTKLGFSDIGDKWGAIITLRGQSLFTPDAELAHKDLLHKMKKSGFVAGLYILDSDVPEIFFSEQIKRIYEGAGVTVQFAEGLDEARNLMKELLEVKK